MTEFIKNNDKMEKIKVRLSRDVEQSIKNFESTTISRKLQLFFKGDISMDDLVVLTTLGIHFFLNFLGTGTFGRVKLVKIKKYPEVPPMALKMLKKKEMIRLKQIDHVKSEKAILAQVKHPFIIEL